MRFYKLKDKKPPFGVPILIKLDEYWVKEIGDNDWWYDKSFRLKDVPKEYFGKVCPFYYVVTAGFDERRGKIMFTEAGGEEYSEWSEDKVQGWAELKDIWKNEEWG